MSREAYLESGAFLVELILEENPVNLRIGTLLISAFALFGSYALAQTSCPAQSTNISNFNGTAIQPGSFIWLNANFTASGIPSTGATISFAASTVTFTADQAYTVNVPKAAVTFDPNAACAFTTFDTQSNTWTTTVPLAGSDEIFLTGVVFPVPAGFAAVNGKVQGPVTWQGSFSSDTAGISVAWKWSAAVYNVFSLDYNVLGIKPTHTRTCLYNNSDHAGTPEGVDSNSGRPFKAFVTGGARGGGGSEWTGSWSGTQGVQVCANPQLPQ
jgi:hypothetical protein